MTFAGQTAIATGAASGIGRAVAERLAAGGAAVADLNRYAAEPTAGGIESAGGKAIGIELDVTDETAVIAATDRVAEAFGSVDMLVSNAHGWYIR